jgi:hypothetical protein
LAIRQVNNYAAVHGEHAGVVERGHVSAGPFNPPLDQAGQLGLELLLAQA